MNALWEQNLFVYRGLTVVRLGMVEGKNQNELRHYSLIKKKKKPLNLVKISSEFNYKTC